MRKRAHRTSRKRVEAMLRNERASLERAAYSKGVNDGRRAMTPVTIAQERSIWVGERPRNEQVVYIPGEFCVNELLGAPIEPHRDIMVTLRLRQQAVMVRGVVLQWADWEVGDITPATAAARSLAMLEMVAGQLYLAAFVARLVGVMGTGQQGNGQPPLRMNGPSGEVAP